MTKTVYHLSLNGSAKIFIYMILRSRRKSRTVLEFSWKMCEILWKAIATAFELPEATIKNISFIRRISKK